jgi:hypothetical protein
MQGARAGCKRGSEAQTLLLAASGVQLCAIGDLRGRPQY